MVQAYVVAQWLLGFLLIAPACQRDAPPVTKEARSPTAAPAASASPAAAETVEVEVASPGATGEETADPASKSRYDESQFKLALEPGGDYQAGKEGIVTVTLSALPPFKVNDQYPHKFKAKDAPGVKFASAVFGKDKAKLEKQSLTLPVRFSPEKSGKVTVAGQFSFSVCTDENCLLEKRDLALTLDVK
jgi:hypothetical protein